MVITVLKCSFNKRSKVADEVICKKRLRKLTAKDYLEKDSAAKSEHII